MAEKDDGSFGGIPKELLTELLPFLKKKLEAEAARATQDARLLAADARASELIARKGERDEKEYLASDKFHHVYIFNDSVNAASVSVCMKQLTAWSRLDSECKIEIVFNSPGGSVMDGMALFDFIQTLRRSGHYITTVALGYAASMAGILLQAGDHRVCSKEAYVLIHEISTGAIGKIGELEDVVEFAKKIQTRVLNIFASRSRKTAAYFATHWRRKDWWLNSDECMQIGIVDEVR